MVDKDRLYDLIDEDDDLSDKEKREIYFSELEEHEEIERWQNDN